MAIKTIIIKSILPVAALIFGLLIGIFTFIYYMDKHPESFIPSKYYTWEYDEAHVAYYQGNTDVAQYALEHLASILEYRIAKEREHGWRLSTARDLVFTYVRMGKVAESKGEKEKARKLFDHATEIFNRDRSNPLSYETLRLLVDKLDAKGYERTYSTFGSIFAEGSPNQQVHGSGAPAP
jgi:tetratricopeptide (TPR) repeat protein